MWQLRKRALNNDDDLNGDESGSKTGIGDRKGTAMEGSPASEGFCNGKQRVGQGGGEKEFLIMSSNLSFKIKTKIPLILF